VKEAGRQRCRRAALGQRLLEVVGPPAPPLAITGIETASLMARVSAMS
jgi:hypothetical protein